jgi:hypothetical protein
MGLFGLTQTKDFRSIVYATVLSTHRIFSVKLAPGRINIFSTIYPLRTGTYNNPCETFPWTEVLIEGSFANHLLMRLTESEVVKQ